MRGNDLLVKLAPASLRVSNTAFRVLRHNWDQFNKELVGSREPSAMRVPFFILLVITSCGSSVLHKTYMYRIWC